MLCNPRARDSDRTTICVPMFKQQYIVMLNILLAGRGGVFHFYFGAQDQTNTMLPPRVRVCRDLLSLSGFLLKPAGIIILCTCIRTYEGDMMLQPRP